MRIYKYALLQIRIIIANMHYYCKYALLWPRQFTFEHFRLCKLSLKLNSETLNWVWGYFQSVICHIKLSSTTLFEFLDTFAMRK